MTTDLPTLSRTSCAGAHTKEQDLFHQSLPLECIACGGGWVVVLNVV